MMMTEHSIKDFEEFLDKAGFDESMVDLRIARMVWQASEARMNGILLETKESMQKWINFHNERADKAEAELQAIKQRIGE